MEQLISQQQQQQSIKKGGGTLTTTTQPYSISVAAENILYTNPQYGDRVILMYLEGGDTSGEGTAGVFYDNQQQEQQNKKHFTNDSPLLPLIQVITEDHNQSSTALRNSPMHVSNMMPIMPKDCENQQFMALRKSKYGGAFAKNAHAQNMTSSIDKNEQAQPQHLSMAQLTPLLQLSEQQFDDQVNQLFTSGNTMNGNPKKDNNNTLFNYQQLTAKANQIRARQYFPVSHSSSIKKHHNSQVRSKSSMNHARNHTINTTTNRSKASQQAKGAFHVSHSNQESMDESSGTNLHQQQMWQGGEQNFSATIASAGRHAAQLAFQKTYQPVLKSSNTNVPVRIKRSSIGQSSLHEGSITVPQFQDSPRNSSMDYRLNAQRYPGFNEGIYHAFLDQVVKHFNEELPQDLLSDLKLHYLLKNSCNKVRDPRTIKRPHTQQEQVWQRKPSISPELSSVNRQGTVVQIPPPTQLEQQIYKNHRLTVPSPQHMNSASNNSRRSPKGDVYNII